MDMNLDFDLTPTTGQAPRHNRRGAIYALRLLLAHPDIRAAYMDDCESLLRLLGSQNIVWPPAMTRTIIRALRKHEDEEANDDPAPDNLAFYLKSRHAWNTYENTVSRIHGEDPKLLQGALAAHLARLKPKTALRQPGNRNTRLLAKLLGLDAVECSLLDFAELRAYEPFRNFLRAIGGFTPGDAYGLLAAAIDVPVATLRSALRVSAPLRAYNLVRLDPTPNDLEDFLRLDEAGQMFLTEDFSSPHEMLRVVLQPAPSATLEAADYPHLEREFTWLAAFLQNAVAAGERGANVLLYGAPGTGKSEFARLLAHHAGLTAFDVKSADADGSPVSGRIRLSQFALSQRFLAESERSLIIFDEIEDVFPNAGLNLAALFGRHRPGSPGEQAKAWVNQQLENSPVPAIWISNSVDAIDEAFLRRFAFHVEFRTPPRRVRERILRRCLGDTAVSAGLLQALAADDSLSPAQVSQATRFATLCGTSPGATDEAVLLEAVRASQTAMGRTLQGSSPLQAGGGCNFAYLNLDTEFPVARIEAALRRLPAATLCFYGVPGAGKTSLARHLADAVGRPLLVRRASDLLAMYLGETEKRIARMFRDATREGAVLLLDEADSFLRSRGQAQRSWEVTQVNELLQQMEAFAGIFVCTTNLMDDVDEAAMRRFTFKVRFDALTATQREAMFAEMTNAGDGPLAPDLSQALARLDGLTPGDFATVRRQQDLLGEAYGPAAFLQQLAREWALKPGRHGGKMGFLG